MYTHRSNMLHALITVMPDALGLGSESTMLVGAAAVNRHGMEMETRGM